MYQSWIQASKYETSVTFFVCHSVLGWLPTCFTIHLCFIYLFSAIIRKHYVSRRHNLCVQHTVIVVVTQYNCKRAGISRMLHRFSRFPLWNGCEWCNCWITWSFMRNAYGTCVLRFLKNTILRLNLKKKNQNIHGPVWYIRHMRMALQTWEKLALYVFYKWSRSLWIRAKTFRHAVQTKENCCDSKSAQV